MKPFKSQKSAFVGNELSRFLNVQNFRSFNFVWPVWCFIIIIALFFILLIIFFSLLSSGFASASIIYVSNGFTLMTYVGNRTYNKLLSSI